jgi:hypothetical protein
MKTLDEHNRDIEDRQRETVRRLEAGVGVACPHCGSEMREKNPGTINLTLPSTRTVVYTGRMR